MSTFVAIDPGIRNLGVAIYQDDVLAVAYLAKSSEILEHLPRCDEVVIEKMQVYRASIAKSLIDLSLLSGEIAGAMFNAYGAKATYYLPAEWKGQAPKDVIHARARAKLDALELARIELPRAKKTQLDVMDAVAIGLAHLRKTNRRA